MQQGASRARTSFDSKRRDREGDVTGDVPAVIPSELDAGHRDVLRHDNRVGEGVRTSVRDKRRPEEERGHLSGVVVVMVTAVETDRRRRSRPRAVDIKKRAVELDGAGDGVRGPRELQRAGSADRQARRRHHRVHAGDVLVDVDRPNDRRRAVAEIDRGRVEDDARVITVIGDQAAAEDVDLAARPGHIIAGGLVIHTEREDIARRGEGGVPPTAGDLHDPGAAESGEISVAAGRDGGGRFERRVGESRGRIIAQELLTRIVDHPRIDHAVRLRRGRVDEHLHRLGLEQPELVAVLAQGERGQAHAGEAGGGEHHLAVGAGTLQGDLRAASGRDDPDPLLVHAAVAADKRQVGPVQDQRLRVRIFVLVGDPAEVGFVQA